jgi:hypothetical protein
LTSQLLELWCLEEYFDQRKTDDLIIDLKAQGHNQSLAYLVYLVGINDLSQAISYGKELFKITQDTLEKVFIHHWVIGCLETLYKEDERRLWFDHWNQIENWTHFSWAKYIKKYQMAVGLYFESHFREALSLFEQLVEEAKSMEYQRGVEKCLFHIALIHKCLNHYEACSHFLNDTKAIAQTRNSSRMLERIGQIQKTLNDLSWQASPDLHSVELLLCNKKNRAARRQLLHALKVRRIEKRSWGAYSELMYIAIVSLSFGNLKRFERIYKLHIKDNLIKERTLSLTKQISLDLPDYLNDELLYLRQVLGICSTRSEKSSEFLGINFNKIKDPEAINVIRNLSSKIEGMSKEELCVKLWNYDYDPTLHDRRIYKLIYRIKEIFRCSDAIIAKGGLYRINPKYLNI